MRPRHPGRQIPLEYEGQYDWLAFVPRRTDDASALTKYFGRRANPAPDEGRYKTRGIECRQRSTCPFVTDAQLGTIERLDETRNPEADCATLRAWTSTMEIGRVDRVDLAVTRRVSKRADEYDRRTRTVAALERAAHLDVPVHPGESVSYAVAADDADPIDRVQLASEAGDDLPVDVGFYRERLVRAAESVLSALGWREEDIERHLAEHMGATLAAFGEG